MKHKVKLKIVRTPKTPKLGDLYKNDKDQLIMVTEGGSGGFNTTIVQSGKCWTGTENSIEETLTNLRFVARGAKITVEIEG